MNTVTLARAHDASQIRAITLNHPWSWLAEGWEDISTVPTVSYLWGAVFAAMGFILLFGLDLVDMDYLILPLALGFVLVGPIAAVAFYETSRRLGRGQAVGMGQAFAGLKRNGGQIALVGLFLLLALFAWIRLASLEFMLFYGNEPPALDNLYNALLMSPQSVPFLALGLVTGAGLGAVVFAMTAVAVPMLIDHSDCDAMTAMLTSLEAVRQNWRPMMLWAALIGTLTLFGTAMLFVGLVVVMPLLGHASWHAYRDLVED